MKKNIVIIILSVVILGLGGYLVYDKVLSSDNKEEVVEKQDDKEIYFTMARNYIDNIIDSGVYKVLENLSKDGLTDELKTLMAMSNVRSYESNCENAFDIDPNTNGYFSKEFGEMACSSNKVLNLFDYDSVNMKYKKIFGTSENAPKKYIANIVPYEYSSKANSYVELYSRRSAMNSLYYYYIEEVEATDSKLKIKISYLSYHYVDMTAEAEHSDSFSYYIGETLYENKTKEEVIKSYNENKKSLPNLTFNYEQEDGRYILKSVE